MYNRVLLLVIAVADGIILISILIAIIVAPAKIIAMADYVPIRLLLFTSSCLLILALSVMLYWFYYEPSYARVFLIAIRTSMFLAVGAFGMPAGLLAVKNISVIVNGQSLLNVTFGESAVSAVAIIFVALLFWYLFGLEYGKIKTREAITGVRI